MPKIKDMYAVILAGGSGERFWPMSTSGRPKQFLAIPHLGSLASGEASLKAGPRSSRSRSPDKLGEAGEARLARLGAEVRTKPRQGRAWASGKPLICDAVERIEKLIPKKQIFIITRQDLAGMARRVLPGFPKQNIIGEPCGRDTAAAVALGTAVIKRRNPSGAFCVLTADHVIGNHNVFLHTLREAFRLALSSDCLVTIGIKPGFPSTGFGYIEADRNLQGRGGINIFRVRRFVEKPDKKTANKYIKKGNFYWNSGMFIWSVAALEKAIAVHRPQLTGLIRAVENASGGGSFQKVLKSEYKKLDKISVDYAILEKADNIIMVRSNFFWDDVGSWAALEQHCRKDKNGNIILGDGEALEASNNIVVAEDGVVALVGVRNLVVVRSGAATLVCSKAKAQDVKKMVALMKSGDKYKDIV